MSSQEFFWYVFPWIVNVVGGAWLIYDYYKHPEHRIWKPKREPKKSRKAWTLRDFFLQRSGWA
jgi:hypothetical protein